MSLAYIGLTEGGVSTQHYFPLTVHDDIPAGILGLNYGAIGGLEYTQNLQVHYYADPGSGILFFSNTTDRSGNTECIFQVEDYLISYP